MTLLTGRRRPALSGRLDALDAVLALAPGRLEPELVERAQRVAGKAGDRLRFGHGLHRGLRTAGAAPHDGQRRVARDRRRPQHERGPGLEPVEVAPGRDLRLLHRIERIGVLSGEMEAQTVDPAFGRGPELAEGLLVATTRPAHQPDLVFDGKLPLVGRRHGRESNSFPTGMGQSGSGGGPR